MLSPAAMASSAVPPSSSSSSSSSSSRPKSLLDASISFFDSAALLLDHHSSRDGNTSSRRRFQTSLTSPPPPLPPSSSQYLPPCDSSQVQTLTELTMTRWSCSTCRTMDFSSLDDQRSHFKSDFHRLNVKRKFSGKEALSEEEFEMLVERQYQRDDDISSISGSEDEESNSSEDENVQAFAKPPPPRKHNQFFLSLQNSDEIAALWKCVILRENEKLCKDHQVEPNSEGGGLVTGDEILQRLKRFASDSGCEEKHLWVVLLSTGGHFAGSVFDARNGSILAHKTHHRYVVRAKAGGRQSTRDATGRAPKSAGASLRRHNEAALQREIRDLLISWNSYLEVASRIFLHAPSRNNRAFFGGDGGPLKPNDRRICNIPVTTRRPTFKETKRIFYELTSICYEKHDCIEMDAVIVSDTNPLTGSSANKEIDGVNKDENLIQVSPPYIETLSNESSDMKNIVMADAKTLGTSTPLHAAAQMGDVHLVLELLENASNPCVRDERGRTPYSVAADKETRNIFRKFMAQHTDMWDWHAANVPSALTEEMEAAQAAKQAEKEAKRKSKTKELKKLRKEKQRSQELAMATSKVVISQKKTLAQESVKLKQNVPHSAFDDAAQRAKEREMRAAAAEKRISAVSSGLETSSRNITSSLNTSSSRSCSFCGMSLLNMTPFYRFSYQYCSTRCVNAHRLVLESP